MSELPSGWLECALEDVVNDINYGYTAKSNPSSGNAKMLRITDIQDNKVDWSQVPFCEITLSDREKYLLKKWDLVFARTGATVGKSFLIRDEVEDAVFASYLIRVRAVRSEMAGYLSHFFNSPAYWDQITEFSAGIGQPNVNGSKLKSLRVPLAPLSEQKRISDKLDQLLARVDACRERLDRIPVFLKRFRQAVLDVANSGQLTESWRTENGANHNWQDTTLNDVCVSNRVITYGVIKLGNEISDGVPCLRTSNVRWLKIDTDGIKNIAPSLSSEYSRTVLRGEEVLVNVRGTLGGVAVTTAEMAGWNVSREIAVVPVDTAKISPQFLAYMVGSLEAQRWLNSVEKGVAYVGINIEDLRNLPIKLPSLLEQHEIIRRVETLFAFADRLEARYRAARAQVDRLAPALLAKAFRGELVPQDPGDEPAAALLERIRAARATAETATGRKPRRPRSAKPARAEPPPAETPPFTREDIAPGHLAALLREHGPLSLSALWLASRLPINDFEAQLQEEAARGLLREIRPEEPDGERQLEAA